jgi:hypothetical protein
MLTVCPQCHSPLDRSERCPKCSVSQLVSASLRLPEPPGVVPRSDKWQQTPAGRILIGVLLAVGLSYGLLQLCTAGLRATQLDPAEGGFHPLAGLALLEGLQAVALLAGGTLAGVGQRRGIALGAVVGVVSGMLFLMGMLNGIVTNLVHSLATELLDPGSPVRNVALYALPILHVVCGAAGGLAGSLIWKPPPAVAAGRPGTFPSAPVRAARRPKVPWPSPWDGPVAWVRVLLGTVVAVTGAIGTKAIIDLVLYASEGKLMVMTTLEDQVTYAEVFSFAILLGGCCAGASTFNGLKQGVCLGLIASLVMTGVFVTGSFQGSAPGIYPVLSILFLAPIGGWFGSQLLPPVCRRRRVARTWF